MLRKLIGKEVINFKRTYNVYEWRTNDFDMEESVENMVGRQ